MKNQLSSLGIVALIILFVSENVDMNKQPTYSSRNVEESVMKTKKIVNDVLDKNEKKIVNEKPEPEPSPNPDTLICRCNGSKVITHGDGHQTPCQCNSKPGGCICKPLNPPLPREEEEKKLIEKPLPPELSSQQLQPPQ